MEDISLLKQIPLFREFKATELMNVSMVATRAGFAAGELIFKERSRGDSFCVIKSGQVRVIKADTSGEEHVLAVLKPGEYFGEISLLDHSPRSASVYADSNTELLIIKAQDFDNLIAGNQEIERKFYKSFSRVLCDRLRVTNDNLTFSREVNRMIEEIEGGQ
jgi:CRP/FNR family transcriptional regulator, cyclic AMP receptor protein